MSRQLDDRTLESWLVEGPSQLPGHVIEGIVRQLDETKQRRSAWLPGRKLMNRMTLALGGAAAVVVVAVLVLGMYVNRPGVGSQPAPTPSPKPSPTEAISRTSEPTEAPSPPATTRPYPDEGVLAPGTYVFPPLPAPNDSLTVTFTVAEGWEAFQTALVPSGEPDTGPPGGMAILFEGVTSLNGDPCNWSGTDDDVRVGPAVDDLVEALGAQTAYEISDPVDVTIGGYGGKRVDIVIPTEPFAGPDSIAPECDQDTFQLWNTAAHGELGIYAQGPADRWRTNILDVDGTRLVIVTRYFAGTTPADRAEMDAIIDSIVIEP